MELAPIPDYKSNCTFQTDKRSLSFNYAHVVFNKHFHLAAARGNVSKGAADAAWAGGSGPGSGSGCGPVRLPRSRARTASDLAQALPAASLLRQGMPACVFSAGPTCIPSVATVSSQLAPMGLSGVGGGRTGTYIPSHKPSPTRSWCLQSLRLVPAPTAPTTTTAVKQSFSSTIFPSLICSLV